MKRRYVVCVDNRDYEASLELRKIYRVIPEPKSEKLGLVRIIDESGEDYLYPIEHFLPIALPKPIERALAKAS